LTVTGERLRSSLSVRIDIMSIIGGWLRSVVRSGPGLAGPPVQPAQRSS
jgi:hypothetical protein